MAHAISPPYAFNFVLDRENSITLDGAWEYQFGGVVERGKSLSIDSHGTEWESVEVPENLESRHPKETHEARVAKAALIGTYRKAFDIESFDSSKRYFVRFVGVSRSCKIWLNGQLVGEHVGMYDAFDCEITEQVRSQNNELIVAVRSPLGSERPFTFLGSQDAAHSRTGSGIWGSVYIVSTPTSFARNALIRSDLDSGSISVDLACDSPSGTDTETIVRVVDPESDDLLAEKRVQGDSSRVVFDDLPLKHWELDAPKLYELHVSVNAGHKQRFRFGYRAFQVDGRRFMFNHKLIYLKALCFWTGHVGNGQTDQEARDVAGRLIEGYKKSDTNIIRTAHRSAHSQLAVAADEIGYLLYVEFGNQVDVAPYLPGVSEEIKRLVVQYYNHPSVVMYSIGNEVWQTRFVDPHETLYQAMKRIDDTRPICAVSGGHSWPGDPVAAYEHTDFFDVHVYSGHMDRAWNQHTRYLLERVQNTLEKYYGGIDRPVFVGESVGMSWPSAPLDARTDEAISPERYVRLANSGTTPMWASQVGMWRYYWPVDRVGRADEGRANMLINERLVKLLAEQMRALPTLVQGFCMWSFHYSERAEKIAFADILPIAWDIPRHYRSGEEMTWPVLISNVSSETSLPCELDVRIVSEATAEVVQRCLVDVPAVPAVNAGRVRFSMKLPDGVPTGFYDLQLQLVREGQPDELMNDYRVFIFNDATLKQHSSPKTEVIYLIEDVEGRYAAIAEALRLKAVQTRGAAPVSEGKVAVLSLNGHDLPARVNTEGLRQWVEAGGRLLIDRIAEDQNLPVVEGFKVSAGRGMPSVELVSPEHPIFRELDEDNFFFWDGDAGEVIQTGIYPLTENVLLGKAFDQSPTMGLAAFQIGKGVVLANQLYSAEQFDRVSSAQLFTANMLSYLMSEDPEDDARQASQGLVTADYEVDPDSVFFVDISQAANRAFSDDAEGDGKGGWTDQGALNLGMIESGIQVMGGIPFNILNEQGGARSTCIVTRGTNRPAFPEQSERIPVNRKANSLYFLHTSAWCARQYVGGRPIAHYVIEYEDGLTIEVPVIAFQDVADWWNPSDLIGAPVAWRSQHPTNPDASVGLYVMKWDNPNPEKMVINVYVRSAGLPTVPILVGISGVLNPETSMTAQ